MMGGAAGALKTCSLLMDGVTEFWNPNLRGVLFRETYPNLDEIIRMAHGLYRPYPYCGRYNKVDRVWNFPTNALEISDPANIEHYVRGTLKPIYVDGQCAQIMFRHLDRDDDVEDYQGQSFSWIGIDESTHQTEFRVRYLLSRLRSTDQTLRLRMRLATNPGGDGHAFHMKVFLGDACPHCQPNEGRRPFVIYRDAEWSDGTPLSSRDEITREEVIYTTQFIPGKVTDHELFGKGNVKYKAQLRMQRPATADALLAGCWKQFEGQYFTCWEENRGMAWDDFGRPIFGVPDMRMVVKRAEVETEPWWPHFAGADYGFTISHAGSHLFVRTPKSDYFPNGRIYALMEYLKAGVVAEDFARDLLNLYFLENGKVPDRPKAIQLWALSPDAWNQTGQSGDMGVALSRADQMNAVMEKYGMAFVKADNERPGGWMHMWRMLRSGELVICGDTCPNLVKAIPTRIHDPKKLDDIKKILGDPLDDCIDDARYGLKSWQREGTMPFDLQLAERIKGLDPTAAMMTRAKFREEVSKTSGPVFVGRNALQRQKMYQESLRSKRNF